MRRLRRDALTVSSVLLEPIVVRDPDDEFLLAAALNGGVDVLVTGDKDLLTLANEPHLGSLTILDPAAFATMMRL